MPDAEHVLRVDRGVIARPARGDDDVIDLVRAHRLDQRADDLRRATKEACRDLGLFEDLVPERHPVVTGSRTGRRPVASPSPASTAARASSEPGRIEYVASAVDPGG